MTTRKLLFLALGLFCLLGTQSVRAADDGWRQLTPTEKERVLRNYRRWQSLPPQDKEHLREQWDRWQSLPQDRRERLKQRYNDQRRDRRRD
jgi:hypothetical protein